MDVLTGHELSLVQRQLDPVYDVVQRDTGRSCRIGLFKTSHRLEFLHEVLYRPACLELVESLIGPDLVMGGAALIVGLEGQTYKQGWHRDILQIPAEHLDDRQFSRNWFHNCIQVNLAFEDDESFWCVPGSHNRPNTPAEAQAFGEKKYDSPIDAEMPGGRAIELKSGQGIFYNNNVIHRGHNADSHRRLTLHYVYHGGTRPPSVHFYQSTLNDLDSEQIERLSPPMRVMYERYLREMAKYPNVRDTWRLPDDFVPEYEASARA